MTDTSSKKFMVFFMIPLATMTEWAKTDAKVREAAEQKMMQEWQQWSAAHADMILSVEAGGKSKNVIGTGVSDTRNDIVMVSTVQGSSHEAVAQAYQDHPHLQIPSAFIQVMELRAMG